MRGLADAGAFIIEATAHNIAGSVLRRSGSSKMLTAGSSGNCSRISSASALPVTTKNCDACMEGGVTRFENSGGVTNALGE